MTLLQPIKSNSLHNLAFTNIKNIIMKDKYKLGEKLPTENELCEQLQISRNILREVMKSLQAIGLVKVVQGSGTIVANPKVEMAQDIIEMHLQRNNTSNDSIMQARLIYEPGIAYLAAQNREQNDIDRMLSIIKSLNTCKNISDAACLDLEFHTSLVYACKNEIFLLITKPLLSLQKKLRLITLKNDGLEIARNQHQKIYNAVLQQDSETAKNEMQNHLENAYKIYNREK